MTASAQQSGGNIAGWSSSHWVAGFVAVLVGFASSVAIVFQAAAAAGARGGLPHLPAWLPGPSGPGPAGGP